MSAWSWLKPSIDRGVQQGVKSAFDKFTAPGGRLDEIIRDELAKPKYAWFVFLKHMQARMLEVDPTMDRKESFEAARHAYIDFLDDEKIQFGDPRYAWDEDGARDIIQSYEIDHWESAA